MAIHPIYSFQECYEYGYEPAQRSMDLMERKYKRQHF